MKNIKGITLIALIITIIVMMILVGVTVSVAINGGLFGNAKEASFKTMMTQYKEQVDVYMVAKRVANYTDDTTSVADINAGATDRTPKIEIREILGTEVKKGYEEKIAVEMGELYYVPVNPEDKKVKNEVKWCFELGIKVKGYSSYEDFELGTAPVSDGSYEAVGEVYLNTPDLTGFSKANTYYVIYDDEGKNETIGGRIIEEAPSNWYNYQNKIWANVVTKGNGGIAYWVWIPRYAYKITYYTDEGLTQASPENAVTQYGSIDVKFLSKENLWKDYNTGEEIQYTEETLKEEGFTIPETFSWGEEANKIQLAGYWVSKYEVSEGAPLFNIEKTSTSGIKIISSSIKNRVGPYKYYLNGELKYTGTSDYTFENLEPYKTYEIKVEDKDGIVQTRKVYPEATIIADSVPKTTPDLSGFKDANAYYVTYDESGKNETIGEKITFDENGNPTNIPQQGWYNYQNKIWANIVTASEDLTDEEKADITKATTKKVAYWVWIPRYEYKIIDNSTQTDYVEGDKTELVSVNFIDTNTTTPTKEGYTIPETFSWGEDTNKIQLPGYWVSKYEVSN